MNSAANFGGIFIVLDVTALTCFCTNYKCERDNVYLKTFTRDEVVTQFRLTQDQYSGLEKAI